MTHGKLKLVDLQNHNIREVCCNPGFGRNSDGGVVLSFDPGDVLYKLPDYFDITTCKIITGVHILIVDGKDKKFLLCKKGAPPPFDINLSSVSMDHEEIFDNIDEEISLKRLEDRTASNTFYTETPQSNTVPVIHSTHQRNPPGDTISLFNAADQALKVESDSELTKHSSAISADKESSCDTAKLNLSVEDKIVPHNKNAGAKPKVTKRNRSKGCTGDLNKEIIPLNMCEDHLKNCFHCNNDVPQPFDRSLLCKDGRKRLLKEYLRKRML